jgi:hypothetical protein
VSLMGRRLRVRHHVSVTDWVRRLGWWGLWLAAQRSMHLWLAHPTHTASKVVALSRRNGGLVDEHGVRVRRIADDTTRSARTPRSHASS